MTVSSIRRRAAICVLYVGIWLIFASIVVRRMFR